MFDVLITAAVIVAAGALGYSIGKRVGREEAQAEIYHLRRFGER